MEDRHATSRDAVSTRSSCAGFTMLELLVVLAILSLLATVAVPPVIKYLGKAKTDTARVQIHNLGSILDLYRMEVGRYPTPEEGLKALMVRPAGAEKWNGPYLSRESGLIDPWGTPFVYRVPGEHGEYDLYTLGADKAIGGTGENEDVTNW